MFACYAPQMISESHYWKGPLLTGAKVIRKIMGKMDASEAEFARVEREIFIGFYAIRKLLEATGKLSSETHLLKLSLTRYKKREGKPTCDWYNRQHIFQLYDLDSPTQENLDLIYVAHRMVHSFIFDLAYYDNHHGAFFTSDRDKDKVLNFVRTEEIVRAFETVGNDYPSRFVAWRDEMTGEMKWNVPAKGTER